MAYHDDRRHLTCGRPSPDLSIVETRVYRGANVWSYEKAIHLVVDLGVLEEYPTNSLPGFTDNLLEFLPGLRDHSCSRGRRGGFVERLNEGTWLGHVAEHVALGLQQVVGHDIRRGKTRQVKGQTGHYNVIFGYVDEQVGLAAGQLAVRLVNHLVEADPDFDWDDELECVHPACRAHRVRAVHPGDHRRGRLARHPLDPAQPVLTGPARPGRARQADPRHDDVGDLRDRGRRGLRQGPDDPAARRGRTSGAQAGLGALGRPGGAAANRIGYPVVVKPLDGNHGRGVCLDLQDEADVREAFPIAEGSPVAAGSSSSLS